MLNIRWAYFQHVLIFEFLLSEPNNIQHDQHPAISVSTHMLYYTVKQTDYKKA